MGLNQNQKSGQLKDMPHTQPSGTVFFDVENQDIYIYNMANIPVKVGAVIIENVVLSVDDWTLVGDFYEYDYENLLIRETSLLKVIPYKETMDVVKSSDIMPMVVSAEGTVKIYAANQPLSDINVAIEIV